MENQQKEELEKKMNEKDFQENQDIDQENLELSEQDSDIENDSDEVARGSRLGNVDSSYRDKNQPGV